MSQLALITPIEGANLPEWGGGIPKPPHISPPIALPPLPPGFVPAHPWLPLPPYDHIEAPIFIPGARPDNSLPGSQPGIDNSLPGAPGLPPHPGGGPMPGLPPHPGGGPMPGTPPVVGGGPATPPGVIGGGPVMPPAIWPPLNPGDGVQGPGLLLVLVLGADAGAKWKWISIDAPIIWPPPPSPPSVAQPK